MLLSTVYNKFSKQKLFFISNINNQHSLLLAVEKYKHSEKSETCIFILKDKGWKATGGKSSYVCLLLPWRQELIQFL